MNQQSVIKKLFGKVKATAILLLLTIVLFFTSVNAQFDGGLTNYYKSILGTAPPGGTIDLENGANDYLECPAGNSAEITASRKIVNVVRLVLYEETTIFLPSDFTATVEVKIEYGPNSSSLQTLIQPLIVSYNKSGGAKYNAKNYLTFEGASYVKVTINDDIDPATSGGVDLADVLYVENEMMVTRYYELQPNIEPVSFSGPASVTNPVDAVPITWSWPSDAGNNATQLEWTWLDDELVSYYYIPSTTTIDIDKLFKNNATRIDLPFGRNSFSIPLFYDDTGKLYYRIRPVNINSDGTRADGVWTTPVSEAGICTYYGHNNDMNWQVRTSFAEEGKMKSVMEYYDGSLRSRQTVTKENVNNTTVAAETFYDYEGRPVIQVLPVPGINTVIKYHANLNLFNSQSLNQNHAEFFDLSTTTILYATTELSADSGASRYYSSSNQEINTGPNKNIPHAEGYPYTVTRYYPDGTGRIMAQSGVGAAHKMGSGRETKYYYGTPGQEELDGLFGTEVGDRSHYFKNMVKDANGQMSVSYVDMHGRTIATALAGDSTANLLAINSNDQVNYPNQNGTSIIRNLLGSNTNITKGNTIESVNTLLVPAPNSYTFKYRLTPESLDLNACDSSPVCYECLYDLEIAITNESGDTSSQVFTYKNLSLSGDVDDDCNTHNPFIEVCAGCPEPVDNEIIITRILDAGSYSIRKTLTISESSLQKYKELFFQEGKGICKTEQEIIDSVYAVMASMSYCDSVSVSDCQDCIDQLGDDSTFRSNFLASINHTGEVPATLEADIDAAYQAQLDNCNKICDSTSSQLNNMNRQMMLADMMPYGGQYATEAPISTANGTTMYSKYNIFSTGGTGQPFYRKPKDENGANSFYKNNLGEVDQQMHPGETPDYSLLNTISKEDFTNQFVYSWADALLPHHPEYRRLLYVEDTLAPANIYNWINSFNATKTYAAALSAGYIMTSSGTITDPLYTVAPSLKSQMAGWITTDYASSGLSMWMMARGNVVCKNIADPDDRRDCYENIGQTETVPPFDDITSTSEKDSMWIAFRGLYAAARDKQLSEHIVAHCPLADDEDLIEQGYQLHFGTHAQTVAQIAVQSGSENWYPSVIGDPPPDIDASTGIQDSATTDIYTTRCESHIPLWKQSLLKCDSLASMSDTTERNDIINAIIEGMLEVCIKGSDASNPFGASTVKPSTPVDGSPRSFEDVIDSVYAEHGIDKNYYCNPYVIESPKPYGKNPRLVQDYTVAVDSCNCANFSTISSQASSAGYNPAVLDSLNMFLEQKFNDTLTAVLHQALLNCSQYYYTKCDSLYDSLTVSCYDPNPCTTTCYAQRSSGGSQTLSEPSDSTAWASLISCFYDLYLGYEAPANMLEGCQSSFVIFYNSEYDTTLTWNQIAALYRSDFGDTLNVCIPCTLQAFCPTGDTTCYQVFSPHYLSSPQPLPEFLKCGFVPNPCLTCDSLVALTSEFKSLFETPYNSGPHFTIDTLSAEQIKQNILFSRFLNFRTGNSYTWADYAEAAIAAECTLLDTSGSNNVTDLEVTTRNGNVPSQYIASNSITFLPNFESGTGDEFETLLQPNGGVSSGSQIVICPNNKPWSDTTGLYVVDTPCHRVRVLSIALGQNIYQQQQLAIQANFEKMYREKCMAAKDSETFTVTYTNKEYHYTLYYYDMAGNLVKTVPPKGVHPNYDEEFLEDVKNERNACKNSDDCTSTAITPDHSFITQYRYNSLNQVVAQNSPDAGTSKFWYDRLGRLVVSQNAQQQDDDKYSYTLYDPLGRIIEVGQKPQTTAMTQTISQDDEALDDWITALSGGGDLREQITYTGYDIPFGVAPNGNYYGLGLNQRNLRNRVSSTYTMNSEDDASFYTGTFYTYDVHGNVDTLLQDYGGVPEMESTDNKIKRIVYNYDLISGKVNMVSYQPDWYSTELDEWQRPADKFFHRYSYDAENRLTQVETSRDKTEWERDASYDYYKHGPLSRTVLGQLQVQGLDYAYTIQGWLKGVNGTTVSDGTHDIGKDGLIGGDNIKVARDIYGFGLHYFDNGSTVRDYKAIGETELFARPDNAAFVSLFNGNIGAMSVNNAGLLRGPSATTNALPLFYNYRYDQLNRIRSMNAFKGLDTVNNLWEPVAIDDYAETISYDPNGNILSYNRKGSPTISGKQEEMDDLDYVYYADKNQLRKVTDNTGYTGYYTEDIDNQSATDNYTYDAIGNLKTDVAEHITNIEWTVYGKISQITKDADDNPGTTNDITTIDYTYDAAGNRITKKVTPPSGPAKATIYVRDASGNVMSVYEKETAEAIVQAEVHLYGSSRLGITGKLTVTTSTVALAGGYGTAYLHTFTRGEKIFELSNHLGNVLVTVSDKKLQVQDGTTGNVLYYIADVITASDYYPFGMLLPERTYTATSSYRYGFGGQMKDDEIYGSGNSYTAVFWQYDPRLGRRWNLDPVSNPSESRYASFRNNPIAYNDPNGDCSDCRDGKYKIQKGDNFSALEKKWGMKQGTLSGYNTGLDPKKLQIGSFINVSPASTSTYDSPSQNVILNVGTTTTNASSFTFDEDFPYDPNAKATLGDRASWTYWGVKGWGGGVFTSMDDGVEAYKHYRNGKGADKTFSFMEYKTEDNSGSGTVDNVEGILKTNLPTILPYAGVRDFNISSVSAGFSSNLFKYPATENWQKAIGAYNFWVTGTVTAKDIAGKLSYSVQYTIHAIDRYNFNKDMKDIKTGTSDNVNGRFSTLGWAQSFLHQGTYSGTLNFIK